MSRMRIVRRILEPIRTPIEGVINHYSKFFEDLIHAVKSELVGKIEVVNSRVDELDRSVTTSHQAIADQMTLQAATLRSLAAEVERVKATIGGAPTGMNGQTATEPVVNAGKTASAATP